MNITWTEEKSEMLHKDTLVYLKKEKNKHGVVKAELPHLWSLEANRYCIINSSHLKDKLNTGNLLQNPTSRNLPYPTTIGPSGDFLGKPPLVREECVCRVCWEKWGAGGRVSDTNERSCYRLGWSLEFWRHSICKTS